MQLQHKISLYIRVITNIGDCKMLKLFKDVLNRYFIFKSELDLYIEDQRPTSQSEVESLIRRYESEKQGVLV